MAKNIKKNLIVCQESEFVGIKKYCYVKSKNGIDIERAKNGNDEERAKKIYQDAKIRIDIERFLVKLPLKFNALKQFGI